MSKHSIVHIEIPTRDNKESAKFYEKLFGWKIVVDEAMDYTMWQPEAQPGGGFSSLGEHVNVGDVLIYVGSEDIEADLNKAVELGGEVVAPKSEIPTVGWFGIFKDPTGNHIALYTSMNP